MPRWRRVLKRLGIALAALLAIVIAGGLLLWNFGGMSGSVHPELFARYDRMVAAGQEPPIRARFVVPIPGCACHSTDPVVTAQHAQWRMSECSRCH